MSILFYPNKTPSNVAVACFLRILDAAGWNLAPGTVQTIFTTLSQFPAVFRR